MKVILAGFSKTGTTTMAEAFTILGYNTYDYLENHYHLHKEWVKIFHGEAGSEDIRKMFEGVDALTNSPVFFYWEELSKAFPNAKKAPKDRLLVFKMSDGWKPLCQFLGVDASAVPFPHKNKIKDMIKETKSKPIIKKLMFHGFLLTSILLVLTGYTGYKACKSGLVGMVICQGKRL